MTTFFCAESPDLKIGPGVDPSTWVVFKDGFAEIALGDEHYDEKVGWLVAERNFHIENLGEDASQVPAGAGPVCPICSKSFVSPAALRGHLLSHRPKVVQAQP